MIEADLAAAKKETHPREWELYDMLRNCGVGVAVANAIDEAKAAADAVCGSNDEDGVARWLEAHL